MERWINNKRSLADLRGRDGPAPSPLRVQILSISCSFRENLAKSYVGAPLRGLASPSQGNPGFAIGSCFGSNPSGRSKGLGCPPRTPPLWSKFFSISYIFLGKFGKIVCWCPLMEGRRPLLRGILEPLLNPTGGFFLFLEFFHYDLEEPLLIFPI